MNANGPRTGACLEYLRPTAMPGGLAGFNKWKIALVRCYGYVGIVSNHLFCVIFSSVFALKLAALLAFSDCALACVNAKCADN